MWSKGSRRAAARGVNCWSLSRTAALATRTAWNRGLDEGVRLNIRPFLADYIPGGKKGAGILRTKPNVHWRKDRGKEPLRPETDFPWFWTDGRFTGNRVNDLNFSSAEKCAAREKAKL